MSAFEHSADDAVGFFLKPRDGSGQCLGLFIVRNTFHPFTLQIHGKLTHLSAAEYSGFDFNIHWFTNNSLEHLFEPTP